MSADRFGKTFTRKSVGKVKGLSPAPFIEERGQVVVRVYKGFISLVSLFGGARRM